MIICGVDLKASEARLALAELTPDGVQHIVCDTRRIALADDKKADDLAALLITIKTFAHSKGVDSFVIRSRAQRGQMAGGAVSFKIEALFQLSGTPVTFISPQALAKFAKSNMGGIPDSVLAYQADAYRSAAMQLSKTVQD